MNEKEIPAENPAQNPPRRGRYTMRLLEIFLALFVLSVLASLLLPQFSSVAVKGRQTQALFNAKQVGLALRLYAGDHNGQFPSFTLSNGAPTTTVVKDSNTAFAQLFPRYVQSENIFWVSRSAWCSANPPDEATDPAGTDVPVKTLARGENEWAYVVGLNPEQNPGLPLVADGFADPVAHTYTTDTSKPGGVWHGIRAVVICVDNRARLTVVDQVTMTAKGPNGGVIQGDIFTTANGANGWLQPENVVVNPK